MAAKVGERGRGGCYGGLPRQRGHRGSLPHIGPPIILKCLVYTLCLFAGGCMAFIDSDASAVLAECVDVT